MSEAKQRPAGAGAGGTGPPGHDPYDIRLFIEDPAGDRYSAQARSDMLVRDLAADYFEERGWPTRGSNGRPQRGVVELVDAENPERSQRLPGDQTLHDAGVRDEDTLLMLPESVAGAVNPQDRLRALVVDQREVKALAASDPQQITVTTNADHAPTRYELTFRYTGVKLGDRGPELSSEHRIEIVLPADYPLVAPIVRWLTPIYHPNIDVRGNVCLGVLAERYLPGLGLAYIVRMLIDIARYRNYDLHGVYNVEAATWARSAEGQTTILALGGNPEEQPLDALLEMARRLERDAGRQRTRFTRVNRFDEDA